MATNFVWKSNECEVYGPTYVYVVRGIVEYEGSNILGIYHKKEDAEKRAQKARGEFLHFPEYPIYDKVVVEQMEVE